jgi:hypothetical protein
VDKRLEKGFDIQRVLADEEPRVAGKYLLERRLQHGALHNYRVQPLPAGYELSAEQDSEPRPFFAVPVCAIHKLVGISPTHSTRPIPMSFG